jgi:hypothetical protein
MTLNSIRSGYRIGTSHWFKHWFSFHTYWNFVVFFWQRATRGWADCDTWSLDYYLNSWMPDALRHLKKHKHGVPMAVFPTEPEFIDKDGNPTEEATHIAEEEWNKIIDKMIAGFEANARMDGLYESELGPYPLFKSTDKDDIFGFDDPVHRRILHERYEKTIPLIERDQKLSEEGLALFVKYYNNLWD